MSTGWAKKIKKVMCQTTIFKGQARIPAPTPLKNRKIDNYLQDIVGATLCGCSLNSLLIC